MKENKLAFFLLLVLAFEILFYTATEARSRGFLEDRSCSSLPSGVAWVNNWRQDFTFECQNSYSIRTWRSQHRNCQEDRIHYFECSHCPMRNQNNDCSYTADFGNEYDKTLSFKCPLNGFVTRVSSTYNSYYKDRKFSFRCCRNYRYCAYDCQVTHLLNGWDQELNYRIPVGYFLVGARSEHNNHYEDRRWKFEICRFTNVCTKK
ncbi:hemagglutinin/amebocyte aggregation factor-like [Montipora capricornis]|uniref:hemagglutinin/amebocyte aggregation factor-like n=1 Tax=Montipora foliosa TaxID=591990 RepID=UPI0035F1C2DB